MNNRNKKQFIRRATIENPAALFPFLLHFLHIIDDNIDTGRLISGITGLGGKTAVAGAAGGAVFSVIKGISDPLLLNGLINKSRINDITDCLARGKVNDSLIDEFLHNEKLMTGKENDEISAKIKHGKKGPRKQPKERPGETDRIENLNRHVVESWTKEDRARWKKTGKKTISNKNI